MPVAVTGGPVQQIAQIIYMYHAHCYLLHTDIHVHLHVQSEGEEAGGVVADHSKGQDTRQSTIAIQTEVDELASPKTQ